MYFGDQHNGVTSNNSKGGENNGNLESSNENVRRKISLPLQTIQSAEKLYDTIAPHLEYLRLKQVATKLRTIKVNNKHPTVVRQVDRAFERDKKAGWLKFILADFLSGVNNAEQHVIIGSQSSAASTLPPSYNENNEISRTMKFADRFNYETHNLSDHPTFVPLVNRENFSDNVDFLMRVRDANLLSNKYPVYFSEGSAKKMKAKNIHNSSSSYFEDEVESYKLLTEDEKRADAERIANFLADRLPNKAHSKLYKLLDRIEKGKTRRMFFYKNAKVACNFHLHLVLTELCLFLSISLPRFSEETFLAELWRDWNATRDELSQSFLESQHRFVGLFDLEEKSVVGATTFEIMSKELNDLREQASSNLPERKALKVQGRVPNVRQHSFNTIFLSEQFSKDVHSQYNEVTDRRVFLSNLPIDTDEEELMDVYGRCGEIECIRIFNRRPDLDPLHNLSIKHEPKSKISRGMMMKKISRTPVYAIIEFATESGFKVATDINLRIFGVILRRHAVKSILNSDMTTLYIENIKGFYALDLGEFYQSILFHCICN